MSNADPTIQHWSVDKRVPIALILTFVGTMIIQSGAVVWWASSISSRVNTLETRVETMSDQRDRIIKVETILERIERKVDRIAP